MPVSSTITTTAIVTTMKIVEIAAIDGSNCHSR